MKIVTLVPVARVPLAIAIAIGVVVSKGAHRDARDPSGRVSM